MTKNEFNNLKIGDWVWVSGPLNNGYQIMSDLIDNDYYIGSNKNKSNYSHQFSSFAEDYMDECFICKHDIDILRIMTQDEINFLKIKTL